MCMKQRPIKRRDMHVDGFDSELHETRIQYKNLNMHNHSLSSKAPFTLYRITFHIGLIFTPK